MAGKQMANDSFASNLAGMSKTQLHDIMSQMKVLIEQNQQQARNILIENPTLTKALFQAQIMLGMVKPPQATPIIQQAPTRPPQQAVQPIHPPSTQTQLLPPQVSQDLTNRVPIPIPTRKQVSNAPVSTISSAPIQSLNHQHPQQQPKGQQHVSSIGQVTPMTTHSQSVHQNMIPHQQLHPSQQQQQQQQQQQPPPSYHHSQIQHISMQQQQQQQQQQQPPLPPQPRPPSMQPYHPQQQYQNPYQTSQPQYQNPNRHPVNIGYGQGQGQPPLPSQPPPHSMYQVSGSGSHIGTDYGNQQGGGPMQVDNRSPWMQHSPPDVAQQQQQLPGPPPLPGLMGPGSQLPPRSAQAVPNEVEKQLLQQVMNLTPDQINLLPPEQRQQVFQLQQMMHGGGRP